MPHTNRPPRRDELAEGARWTRRLIDLLQPQHVAAIGRLAAAAITDVPAVRHPAHGGATASTQQLRAPLAQWLPTSIVDTSPDVY